MGETLSLSTNFTHSIAISTLFSQYVASNQRQQFQNKIKSPNNQAAQCGRDGVNDVKLKTKC